MTIEEAARQFLRDLGIGQADRTVRTYATALNHFRDFLAQTGLDPRTTPAAQITPEHALDWVRWLDTEQPGLARVTLSTYVTALLRFYAHLAMEGLVALSAEEHQQLQHSRTTTGVPVGSRGG